MIRVSEPKPSSQWSLASFVTIKKPVSIVLHGFKATTLSAKTPRFDDQRHSGLYPKQKMYLANCFFGDHSN